MGSGLFIDRQNRTSFRGQFNNGRRKAKTDERARFTLHHKLYGDFAARGELQFGGNEEERRGAAADPGIGGSPPPRRRRRRARRRRGGGRSGRWTCRRRSERRRTVPCRRRARTAPSPCRR